MLWKTTGTFAICRNLFSSCRVQCTVEKTVSASGELIYREDLDLPGAVRGTVSISLTPSEKGTVLLNVYRSMWEKG